MKGFPAFGILFGAPGRLDELRAFLQKSSGLPGPRANLELAYSFAASVSAMHLEPWQWDFLVETARLPSAKAPVNTPKEYLPVCALMAIGALYGTGLPRPRRRAALSTLKEAASDSRWRVREGVAMALQLAGEKDLEALKGIVLDWLPGSSLLEKRAIVAGLAHPPLLGDQDFALFCIDISQSILAALSQAGEQARKDDAFRVLRQALGYALSVFAHHCPAEGFALLRKSAAVQDSDVTWVVKENLKKKRITDQFPKEVEEVTRILEDKGR